MERARSLREKEQAEGSAGVNLPGNLTRKFRTEARASGWLYRFAAPKVSSDPVSGEVRRHRIQARVYAKALKTSVQMDWGSRPRSIEK